MSHAYVPPPPEFRVACLLRTQVNLVLFSVCFVSPAKHDAIACPRSLCRNSAGEAINVNTGEALHKTLKSFAKSASGRDNIVHIARRLNTRLAADAMMEGLAWEARRYDNRDGWVVSTVQASSPCRKLLKTLSDTLSHSRKHGVGRARGTVNWEMSIAQHGGELEATSGSERSWMRALAMAMQQKFRLEDLYHTWYSCGRLHGVQAFCGKPQCPRCWKYRNVGFREQRVRFSNNWTGAPSEVSGGSGTLRGGNVQIAKADDRQWMAESGTDVEIYSNRDAMISNRPGPAGTCSLARVAFFAEHVGNPPLGVDTTGEKTLWVAVAEYVTAGIGQDKVIDAATGHPIMRRRKRLSFFPARAIRRVVHMYHVCVPNKCKAVSDAGKAPVWRHDLSGENNRYIHNEHFHSVV